VPPDPDVADTSWELDDPFVNSWDDDDLDELPWSCEYGIDDPPLGVADADDDEPPFD
jgi:hypothetical protein